MNAPECLRPGGLALTAELVQLAELTPSAELLDAGCGAGRAVGWLREQGFAAWGVDQAYLGEEEWLIRGDMTALPWPDGSFDGYLAECSLSVCQDAAQALAEAYRVLRPGGWLLVSDVCCTSARGPAFSLGEAATMDAWRRLVQAAGFDKVQCRDRTALWKPFVLEAIWAGLDPADWWCGLAPQETGGALGYLLLCGRKLS